MANKIQHSKDQPASAVDLETRVAPRYLREAKTVEQLRRFEGLPPSRIVALACVDEPNLSLRISEETLVALCRRLRGAGEYGPAWKIALKLSERVKGKIARGLRQWRLDSPRDQAGEVIDEIITEMYEAVFDNSPKEAFWEVRFWVAFDRRLLTVLRKRRADLDREWRSGVEEEHAERDDVDDILDRQGNASQNLNDPELSLLIGEALSRMPEAVRTAYILKHVAQMQEDTASEDRSTTIAGVLGVSGRTVRNYLRRAEVELDLWRNGKAAWQRRPRNG